MVDELYWDALFPAAWKQSDVVFRKQFEIPSEIESGEHFGARVDFDLFTFRNNRASIYTQGSGKFLNSSEISKDGFSFVTSLILYACRDIETETNNVDLHTVQEGGCRFMAAWVREEENASNQRQKKRDAEEADKVEVAPGVTVASLRRFRTALIGPTQGLPKRRRLCH